MVVTSLTRRAVLKRLLALGAGAAALAACQPATLPVAQGTPAAEQPVTPSPAAEGPVELTAAWLTPAAYWEPQLNLFRDVNPDIVVNCIEAPVSGTWAWGAFFDKVAMLMAGGVPIDTVRVPIEGAKLAVALGIVQPLDDYLERDPLDEALADIDAGLQKPFQLRGKTWAIPFDFNDMLIWFNTAHFEEAGLEPPAPGWTYEEFLDVATKLTIRTGDQTDRFGFAMPPSYAFQTIPWAFNRGASHLSDDWNTPTMDDPNFLSAIDFMRDLVWKHKVATVDSDPFQIMYSGKASMVGGGRWPINTFLANNFTDGDIALWPVGGASFTEFGVGAQWMTKTTTHPEAVWEVLKFFASEESQRAYHGGGLAIAARKSVALSTSSEGAPAHDQLFYQAFETASPKPVPSPPDYSRIEEPLIRAFQETVVSNELPTAEAWARTQQELTEIIAERPEEWQDL